MCHALAMTHRHPLDKITERSSIPVGVLAASTGVIGTARVLLQDYRAVSVKICATKENHTLQDGAVLWGIMQGNMTLAELEEAIEADITALQGSVSGTEAVGRNYQILGCLGNNAEIQYDEMVRVRLPTFQEDVGLNTFIYNIGDAQTTGSIMKLHLQFFGKWL